MKRRASLGAVITAAGASSRMGSDKALLRFGDRTALALAVSACRRGGVEGVVVVVSATGATVADEARRLGARVAINGNPDAGPLASVQAGLLEVPGDPAGCLVFPVDHAMASPVVVETLACALADALEDGSRHTVFIPVHAGARGHPVCIAFRLVDEVLALPAGATLRDVTLRDPARIRHVEVDDPWVARDLDEQADYHRALAAWSEGRRF
jgi:molybdenum cofactor cytidylyltransferase